MFKFFYLYYQTKKAWSLLAISAVLIVIVTLCFQYAMEFKTCVLCVYERISIFSILAAGLIGAIAPHIVIIRLIAIMLWLYSSLQGVMLTIDHTKILFYPSPFNSCDFVVNFPSWLPLNRWLPFVFEAYGDCSQKQWSFLELEMPVWLLIIFVIYLIVAVLTILSQFLLLKKVVID